MSGKNSDEARPTTEYGTSRGSLERRTGKAANIIFATGIPSRFTPMRILSRWMRVPHLPSITARFQRTTVSYPVHTAAEKKVQDHFTGRPNLQQERLMKMMMSIKTSITQYFLSAKHSTKYQ